MKIFCKVHPPILVGAHICWRLVLSLLWIWNHSSLTAFTPHQMYGLFVKNLFSQFSFMLCKTLMQLPTEAHRRKSALNHLFTQFFSIKVQKLLKTCQWAPQKHWVTQSFITLNTLFLTLSHINLTTWCATYFVTKYHLWSHLNQIPAGNWRNHLSNILYSNYTQLPPIKSTNCPTLCETLPAEPVRKARFRSQSSVLFVDSSCNLKDSQVLI